MKNYYVEYLVLLFSENVPIKHLGSVHPELLAIAIVLAMQKMAWTWQISAKDFAQEWVENPLP